jgi:hypothetical protein
LWGSWLQRPPISFGAEANHHLRAVRPCRVSFAQSLLSAYNYLVLSVTNEYCRSVCIRFVRGVGYQTGVGESPWSSGMWTSGIVPWGMSLDFGASPELLFSSRDAPCRYSIWSVSKHICIPPGTGLGLHAWKHLLRHLPLTRVRSCTLHSRVGRISHVGISRGWLAGRNFGLTAYLRLMSWVSRRDIGRTRVRGVRTRGLREETGDLSR